MSKVISLRLKDDQVARLEREAHRLGRPPSQTAAILLEEALREREFPYIQFRDTVIGRQAFMAGTRIKVWMVESLARAYERDVTKVAEHLDEPIPKIEAALDYARTFPEEMERAIAENHPSLEELKRKLPNLEIFAVDATTP